ncbi:MAG: Xaa-Pro peptidase family protein [Aeropyrum sp.]|nr:Xaa-Pro peptidase family protein [Aeropyrum sp.]MCE4615773.1 Xaa-Pro peptidase family protein [Aeropyrum sp.]
MEPRFDLNRRRLLEAAESSGVDTLILVGEANLIYALGVGGPSGALVLSSKCGSTLLVPLLDYERAMRGAPRDVEVKAFYRGGESGIEPDIPKTDLIRADSLSAALASVADSCGVLGADLRWARWEAARSLAERFEGLRDLSDSIARVRMVKDDWEIAMIEEAVEIIEGAFRVALDSLSPGVSESEVAGAVMEHVLSRGAWGTSFPVIVAFGPNTSLPHHHTGQARLGHKSPVLFDMGAVVRGYMSDVTRSAWFGGGGGEYRRLLEDVAEAQMEAIDAVAPGVEAWEVDKAARLTLERKGLSRYFIHGTGHGVGVEIHEPPFLRPGSKDVLEPGAVVTIEPGVYLPGIHGARIEDMVLVTKRGRKTLTNLARILEART